MANEMTYSNLNANVIISDHLKYHHRDEEKSPDRMGESFSSKMTATGVYVWAKAYPRDTKIDIPILPLILPSGCVNEAVQMQMSGRLLI